jgi:hypothetical protein
MARLRTDPSEAYQARLKAGLLQRLDELEAQAKAKQGSFWQTLWRKPVWQAAFIAVFAVFVAGMLWRMGIIFPELSQPTATVTTTATETVTVPAQLFLSVDASTDKPVYQSGEYVRINLKLTNENPGYLTLGNLPPIVSLMSADTQEPVFTFGAGAGTRTLAPNQTVSFTLTWDQEDFYGQPVTGVYYLEIEDLVYQGQPVQLHLDEPVTFEII